MGEQAVRIGVVTDRMPLGRFPPHDLHQSWLDYLYWDVELLP